MRLHALSILVIPLVIAADESKDADSALKQIEGEWQLVSATRDGKAMPENMVKATRCTVKGDKFSITRDGTAVEEGTLKVDTSKKPKQIDMKIGDATALGIFELDKDSFKLCYGRPGKDRPAEFSAKEGDGQSLSQWKRHKD
jgi:uncharacterized protein (TIGR03067 family)